MSLRLEVVSLLGLALGIGGAGWSIAVILKARRVRKWHHAVGEIVSHRIDRHASSGGTRFSAEPIYTYVADGGRYTGSTADVYQGRLAVSEETALNDIRERFPIGSQVTVHYDPDAPWSSVLTSKVSPSLLLVFGGSLLFILASLRIR